MTATKYLHDKGGSAPCFMVRDTEAAIPWYQSPPGVRAGLYGSSVDANEALFICEGHSDTDAVIASGHQAVTPGSAMAWKPEHAEWVIDLKPHSVIICEDNDEAGERFVQAVGATLRFKVPDLYVCLFRHLPAKGDIRDALESDADVTDLVVRAVDFEEYLELDRIAPTSQDDERSQWFVALTEDRMNLPLYHRAVYEAYVITVI